MDARFAKPATAKGVSMMSLEPTGSARQPAAARASQPQSSTLCGVGLGLRWDFLDEVLALLDEGRLSAQVPFFEVAPENYMRRGGRIAESLERVSEAVPLLSHGLMMSLGSLDPFDDVYFALLRRFLERFAAPWHSDHLCFSGADGRVLHELLPMPRTEAAARHLAARVREARDRLGVAMAVENISYYFELGHSELSEPELVSLVLDEADCQLLLDVNNVYVNGINHGFEPIGWMQSIDLGRVVGLHVAGHHPSAEDGITIDDHGSAVIDPVIDLLQWVIARTGPMPVVLERDNRVPSLEALLGERVRLQAAYERGLREHDARSARGPGS